jgi:hypothetical protein
MIIFIIGESLSCPHLLRMFQKSELTKKIEQVFESTAKNESKSDCKETFFEQQLNFIEPKDSQLFLLTSFFAMVDLVILEWFPKQLHKVDSKAELKNVFEDYPSETWKYLFELYCQWISIEFLPLKFTKFISLVQFNDSFNICLISGENKDVESSCLEL